MSCKEWKISSKKEKKKNIDLMCIYLYQPIQFKPTIMMNSLMD